MVTSKNMVKDGHKYCGPFLKCFSNGHIHAGVYILIKLLFKYFVRMSKNKEGQTCCQF